MTKKTIRKAACLKQVIEYYKHSHAKKEFVPGKSLVQYAGRVYNEKDMSAMVSAVLDFWLTYGEYAMQFEKLFARFHGVENAILTNSGSSANLLAISALLARNLKNGLNPQDEVITPALTFPTTVAPIVQNNLVPVFLDCEVETLNIDVTYLKKALSPRTKAVCIPHTLGNPCNMAAITDFCRKHHLFLIEDTCDALGSKYGKKLVGTFGDLGTFSFYPAHHITLGEGGAVITANPQLAQVLRCLRDWGRTCSTHCTSCRYADKRDGHCAFRFSQKGSHAMPRDYDKRYVFSYIGYNLKPLDIQAALGIEQLKKFPSFKRKRIDNFNSLYKGLLRYREFLILPRNERHAEPVWFAFPITVRKNKWFNRKELVLFLERKKIETRMIFAGNVLRQPGFRHIRHRSIGVLKNSDYVMEQSFFIGVYPGLGDTQIKYILEQFNQFFKEKALA
ncbi:MAG: lipopolysaccharide biosynthesis protein RfbH [Candidatus Omnitrophota bacterium]|nr:MAG: lipopolysaccharide biosynthesis protein RfbH [Candidatus Omnitrophota bacterium]